MIALHKKTCDSPADLLCRPSIRIPGIVRTLRRWPLSLPRLPGLAGGTDGYRASIKRFNFDCIVAPLFAIVNHFSKFLVSLAGVGKKQMLFRLIYGALSQQNLSLTLLMLEVQTALVFSVQVPYNEQRNNIPVPNCGERSQP